MALYMTHSEAMALLAEAAEQLGEVWSRSPMPWVPDEVVAGINEAVERVLVKIDLDDQSWWDTNWTAERIISRNADEVRDLLYLWTSKRARVHSQSLRPQRTTPVVSLLAARRAEYRSKHPQDQEPYKRPKELDRPKYVGAQSSCPHCGARNQIYRICGSCRRVR
jgi:phage gp29-like protein